MFDWASPWCIVLLPLPWLWRACLKAGTQSANALYFPYFSEFITVEKQRGAHLGLPRFLALLIWLLLITAACGPRWSGAPIPIPNAGRTILLALDLSSSMQIPDMSLDGRPVDRLTIVKDAARDFLLRRSGDRLGLILFGSQAYLQTPLTYDRHTVMEMLDDATIGLAGQSTAIGDAIGLGIKQLDKVSEKHRILILLTDGANNSGVLTPEKATEIAAEHHVKIYTIGIGAVRLSVNGLFGPQVVNPSMDLDEDSLKMIAQKTGGEFFRAKDHKQLQEVYGQIDKLEPTLIDHQVYRPVHDYFYAPLLLALLLSFYWVLPGVRARG